DVYHASLFMNEFQDIIHRVDDWI
ncbi:type A chloramphenicol O-acetyltransferase, partial [Staphylococcus aureus]|nr:type A chloramphenicol O-acetyltransferase [Staphylococcus aureus]